LVLLKLKQGERALKVKVKIKKIKDSKKKKINQAIDIIIEDITREE